MNNTYYSNGKLLLTSEYLVLDGAKALAVPTTFGQFLKVRFSTEEGLFWESKNEKGDIWFNAVFTVEPRLKIVSSSNEKIAKTLLEILQTAKKLNPGFLSGHSGFYVSTEINFPKNWGLGTSSTLINNISQWANVDAFELLKKSFGGSGYDIACAQHNTPILFSNSPKKPMIKEVKINWAFKDKLFFVHLNKKQDSKLAIAQYNSLSGKKSDAIKKVNQLTEDFINCTTLTAFETLIDMHETTISNLLNVPKIKDVQFSDYRGSVKSLGAWGGDFVLATRKDALSYFKNKGFNTIIPFNDMLKK